MAKKLKPNDYEMNVNLGNLYTQKKMFKEAMEQFQIAFSINQKDIRISNNVGMLHRKLNNNIDAKSAYEYTLSIDPNNEFALRELSIIERLLGNYESGLKYLYHLEGKVTLKKDYE
jgi:tetratricopeptide (TPR) repeat protein